METKETNKTDNKVAGANVSSKAKLQRTKRLSKAGIFIRKYGNRGEIVDMRAVLK